MEGLRRGRRWPPASISHTPASGSAPIARKQEVQLFLMPLDVIAEEVREQRRHFRFLYVTRAQWEALLAGLECGGQGGV
jgi:hypothetical protein